MDFRRSGSDSSRVFLHNRISITAQEMDIGFDETLSMHPIVKCDSKEDMQNDKFFPFHSKTFSFRPSKLECRFKCHFK